MVQRAIILSAPMIVSRDLVQEHIGTGDRIVSRSMDIHHTGHLSTLPSLVLICPCSASQKGVLRRRSNAEVEWTVRELLWLRTAHSGRVPCASSRDRGIASRLGLGLEVTSPKARLGPRENPSEQWGGSGHFDTKCGRPPWTTATPLPFEEGNLKKGERGRTVTDKKLYLPILPASALFKRSGRRSSRSAS